MATSCFHSTAAISVVFGLACALMKKGISGTPMYPHLLEIRNVNNTMKYNSINNIQYNTINAIIQYNAINAIQ